MTAQQLQDYRTCVAYVASNLVQGLVVDCAKDFAETKDKARLSAALETYTSLGVTVAESIVLKAMAIPDPFPDSNHDPIAGEARL